MKVILKLLLLLFVLIISAAAIWIFTTDGLLESILTWVLGQGIYGNLIFIVGFIIIGFPFAIGYTPLALAAGFIYGTLWGSVTIFIGSMLGATLCFISGRTVAREYVIDYINKSPKFSTLLTAFTSWKVIFLSRLAPIPFGIQNSLLSVSDVSYTTFFSASTLGLIPGQCLWAYIGASASDLHDIITGTAELGATETIIFIIQFVFIILIAIIVFTVVRREWKKTTLDLDNSIILEIQESGDDSENVSSQQIEENDTTPIINNNTIDDMV